MLTTDTIGAAVRLPAPRLAAVLLNLEAGAAEASDHVLGHLAGNDPDKYAEVIALMARGEETR